MIASEPRRRGIPINSERCPIHKSLVARDGEGRLLGQCAGCATEAANALTWMRRNPYALADTLLAQTRKQG